MNRVRFTSEEYDWVYRNTEKALENLERRSARDPEITNRMTYKGLKILKKNLDNSIKQKDGQFDVVISRKVKRILDEIVTAMIFQLEAFTIPTYQKKGMGEYEGAAKTKVEKLKQISRKLQ